MKKFIFVSILIILISATVFGSSVFCYADSTISETDQITVHENAQDEYLLKSKKASAIMQIEYFLESETYTKATKEAKDEIKKITDNAILKIEESNSIAEVDEVLNDTFSALADVNVGGKEWKKMLAVGIALVVILIVAVVGFIIKKRIEIGKPHSKDDDDDDDFETVTIIEDIKANNVNGENSEDDISTTNNDNATDNKNEDSEGEQEE